MEKNTVEQRRKLIANRFRELDCLNLQKIDVEMGTFLNPSYCYTNARQALETGASKEIAEVIYVTLDGLLRFHYIEKHDNKYVDNTLGYLSKEMKYYLLRVLTLEDVKGRRMHEFRDESMHKFLGLLFNAKELEDNKFELTDI